MKNEVYWTLIRISLNFFWIFLILSINWHWPVFLFIILIKILIFCYYISLKFFKIRVHASLFLIFKMFFLYSSSASSCRDSFVDFNDFVWFKSVDNVLYDLNHVNWFDTWHEKYSSWTFCVSFIITTSFF